MLRVSPGPELLNDRLQSLLRQKSRPFARPAGFHLDVHTVVGVKPGEPALVLRVLSTRTKAGILFRSVPNRIEHRTLERIRVVATSGSPPADRHHLPGMPPRTES